MCIKKVIDENYMNFASIIISLIALVGGSVYVFGVQGGDIKYNSAKITSVSERAESAHIKIEQRRAETQSAQNKIIERLDNIILSLGNLKTSNEVTASELKNLKEEVREMKRQLPKYN